MKKFMLYGLILVFVCSGVFAAGAAEEAPEKFPAKPIKIIVGFNAGGGIDDG
ncbi:MAG: hypothetical protein PHR69_05120 [Sphaerochaeta sp.]|nr:hypothetical protein [Sphaerochaeta sp.]